MRPADSDLMQVFLGSFQFITYADAWYDNNILYDDLPEVDGSITFDIDSDIQSTLEITIADATGDLVPKNATDILAPFGQEINISMAAIGSGAANVDPLSVGWYRIQDVEAQHFWHKTEFGYRNGGAIIAITALDRMAIIADAKFLTPEQPASDATVLGEIVRLVGDLVPIGNIDDTLVDTPVAANLTYEDDRVSAIMSLARSIYATLTIDSDGAINIAPMTQYGATPVWTFNVGDGGDIISHQTQMTRDGVINAVVASGESSDDHAPVLGTAYDLDSNSPTYWGGPFGQVPLFYSSPLLTTDALAGQAAATRLNNYRRGREREHTIIVPPNYLLELDDPVNIVLPDRTIIGKIAAMTIPLKPGTMTIKVRSLDTSLTEVET